MSHNHGDHSHHHEPSSSPMNVTSSIDPMQSEANHQHNESNSPVHHSMMKMYFHTGIEEIVLFEFWKISDLGGLIASVVAIFWLAFAYEALKYFREVLYRRSFRAVQYNTVTVPLENGGAVKETHKTVQFNENGGTSYFPTDMIVPIFLSSKHDCACNANEIGADAEVVESSDAFKSSDDTEGDAKFQNKSAPSVIPIKATHFSSVSCPTCGKRTDSFKIPNIHRAYKVKMLSLVHGLQTVLHLVQTILSYFLMLIFMTYNVWLCIAVALGATVGYFFFGWKKSLVVDITEHCH